MKRTIAGQRIIITGASGGIGQAIAENLAANGAKVILAARNLDRLKALENTIRGNGGDALAVPCDVTEPADRQRLIETVVRQWGGLDGLVNNAGVSAWGHFQTSTEALNRKVFEVNFFAPVELTRLCMPELMKGQQPFVLNVTSMCARRGMPAWPEYSASKFALIGMCEALRGELVRFGTDMITIVPGLTKSELNQHLLRSDGKAKIPFETGMEPSYVAARIVEAIRSNRREVVLGGEAKRLIFFNRFAPKLTNWLIARRVKKLYRDNG